MSENNHVLTPALSSPYRPLEGNLNMVNLDVSPFAPWDYAVREEDQHPNRARGRIDLAVERPILFFAEAQKKGRVYINSRGHLADKRVLNANALDFYLKNPHLIPRDWKAEYVFFWGTIYRDGGGGKHLRALHQIGSDWDWECIWLHPNGLFREPAAVLVD